MVWSESESARHFNEILVKLRLFRPISFFILNVNEMSLESPKTNASHTAHSKNRQWGQKFWTQGNIIQGAF